jgi:hypothetical protein
MRTRRRFAGPEWLVTIGGSFFIFTLVVAAIFVPEIRWLHLVQSSLYVAAIAFSLQRSRWGYFIGTSTAGLWDLLALFASPLFAEILDHPARPDLVLQGLASVANLAVVIGSVWGYRKLADRCRQDISRFILTFIVTTGFLIAATAILAPDYLVAFTRAGHPHWPWTRL